MQNLEKLTSRERVRRALNRTDHDRIPRYETVWNETITRWQGEGFGGENADDLLEWIGADIAGVAFSWPSPFRGQQKILSEDESTKIVQDEWGAVCRYWKDRSGTPEHISFGCDGLESWREVYRPAYLATKAQVDTAQALRDWEAAKSKGLWTCIVGSETFEATRKLIGDEVQLESMALEPEWIEEMSRLHTDLLLRDFDALLAAGVHPDGVWLYGDMAYNHATVCSPKMYKSLIWPDHKRIADWAHDRGLSIIYHSDGNISAVVNLYIEAGFDALHPLEAKAGMDVRNLAPAYGDNISFFGNMDIMTMATGDFEAIELEIREKLAAAMQKKGYIYHCDHSIPPSVSWKTYRFVIDLLEKYGSYE
jgi:uroporphyrinogen decarboxylase